MTPQEKTAKTIEVWREKNLGPHAVHWWKSSNTVPESWWVEIYCKKHDPRLGRVVENSMSQHYSTEAEAVEAYETFKAAQS